MAHGNKFVNLENLKYYDRCLKQYINMRIDLNTKKSTKCHSCGAPITSSKCDYCGTDFEQVMIWGQSITN